MYKARIISIKCRNFSVSGRLSSLMRPEWARELGRVLRFSTVGVGATMVHIIVSMTLAIWLDCSNQIANLLAFLTALGVSFYGHHQWSFRSKISKLKVFPRFFLAAGLGYAASAAVIIAFSPYFRNETAVIMIGASLTVPCISYVVNRLFVFR